MYENDYLYAVERDGDHLAHYGIKGMRWGVRKAIERGNSRALGRQYAKAQKKLAKLEKRANSGKKYARRAAALGAGAAVAGGLAALGTSGVSRVLNKGGALIGKGGSAVGRGLNKAGYAVGKFGNAVGAGAVAGKINRGLNIAGNAMQKGGKAANAGLYRAGYAVGKWGNSNSIGNALGTAGRNAINSGVNALGNRGIGNRIGQELAKSGALRKSRDAMSSLKGVSNNTIARIGAGVAGAGLAAGAGYNAYRAATTKRAAKKAAQFRSEMNKAFKGTQYANGAPRQGKKRRR